MLYLSTCVGFGYGLMWELFPGTGSRQEKSSYPSQLSPSVTTHWPTNINVVPIDYAFRPRLRDRLTLRRLTLRRNPWTFGDTVFHSVCRYSCQHSHFRCLQDASRLSLHKPTERSATVSDQFTVISYQKRRARRSSANLATCGSRGLARRAMFPFVQSRRSPDQRRIDTTISLLPPNPTP